MNLTIDAPSLVIEAEHKWPSLQLTVYNELRQKAKAMVTDLRSRGITHVCLESSDEMMDILRLTCIENGLTPASPSAQTVLKAVGQDFQIVYKDETT